MLETLFDGLSVESKLPPMTFPPISRTTLALYAGASGDHNPNHIDIDYAREAGMPDVFAHGMLAMAYLGRYLAKWASEQQIRTFEARFTNIIFVGSRLTCTGEVTEKIEYHNDKVIGLQLQVCDQHGDIKMTGNALVVF